MEHETDALRDMKRQLAELEVARLNDQLRAASWRLFATILGFVTMFMVAIVSVEAFQVFSGQALARIENGTFALFGVAGLGLVYLIFAQFQHQGRIRKDGMRLRNMQLRALERGLDS